MKDSWRSGAAQAILKHTASNNMREAIRVIVAELLRHTTTPPTDLSAVANGLGVSICVEEINGSGELRRSGSKLEIVCNSQQSVPRQRFTVAHELGHVLIHKIHPAANQRTKEIERLCDLFATELIMPAAAFRQHMHAQFSFPDIYSLARLYKTSLLATAHRCAELSNVAIMVAADGKIEQVSQKLRGSVNSQNDEVLGIARRACNGERGSAQLFLTHNYTTKNWNIHYQPLGRDRRALLVFTPAPLPAPVNIFPQPVI